MINTTTKSKLLKHLFGIEAFPLPSVTLCLATGYSDGVFTEVTGGSYASLAVTGSNFDVDGDAIANTAELKFLAMPAVTVTHGFLKDASGNQLAGAAFRIPRVLDEADAVVLNVGDVKLTLAG